MFYPTTLYHSYFSSLLDGNQGPGCQALEATASGSLAGPAAGWLSASELCLGLLHGLATDGLSGLPCASGSQSWLSFASEDLTHFYSFVEKAHPNAV